MSLSGDITKEIENYRGLVVKKTESLSGGCISNAYKVTFEDSLSYLIKVNEHSPEDMFIKEAHGLQELRKTNSIKIPEVILYSKEFILLEFISSITKRKDFFEEFGRSFAQLHKHTAEEFGFYEDNYIGSTPQININDASIKKDWTSFYFNNRLSYQFKLAERNGYTDIEFRKMFTKIADKIESILEGADELPSLLHGDLWGGNFMADDKGAACLIDPAVYYGHREADLAMTKLFGGFPTSFYKAYNEAYPLKEGWEYRENIYMLYHVMNHLNLFGRGYYAQALSLMHFY
jgi:protein-ribulosamine 3-kinase